MYMRNVFIVFCIIAALAIAITAGYAKGLSAQEFVTKASVSNQFEIQSSKLALEKSQNQQVRAFAQSMINDHTKVKEKLNTVLQSTDQNIQPAEQLDEKHREMMKKLGMATGDEFDNKYLRMQQDAHKQDVQLFSNYSEQGQDKALKEFASETLPDLKNHLQHVNKITANN